MKKPLRVALTLIVTAAAVAYILTKVDFNSFPRYNYVSQTSLGEMTGEIYIEKALELVSKNGPTRLFGLDRDEIRIGRDSESEVVLDDQRVSRSHARILAQLAAPTAVASSWGRPASPRRLRQARSALYRAKARLPWPPPRRNRRGSSSPRP